MTQQWPNVVSTSARRITGAPQGEPVYHLLFTAEFESGDDLAEALGSDEMRATMGDVGQIQQQFGVAPDVLFAEDLDTGGSGGSDGDSDDDG